MGDERRESETRTTSVGRDEAHRPPGGKHQEPRKGHTGQRGLFEIGAHASRRTLATASNRARARPGAVQANKRGARDREQSEPTARASQRLAPQAQGLGPRQALARQGHRGQDEHGPHRRGRELPRHTKVSQDQSILKHNNLNTHTHKKGNRQIRSNIYFYFIKQIN